MTETPNIAATIRQMAEDWRNPQVCEITGADVRLLDRPRVVLVPKGYEIKDAEDFLAPYRAAPLRRKGTSALADMDSFIAHANRFKDEASALFADKTGTQLLSVLDYHQAGPAAQGGQRFGIHRGIHKMILSDEWKAWDQAGKDAMLQPVFAELIEERIPDLIAPPAPPADGSEPPEGDRKLLDYLAQIQATPATPAQMMTISRGLRVREKSAVVNAQNLASGEVELSYKSEHTDESGRPLKVPGCFVIAIPVFDAGPLYRLVVRLRYRVNQGAITWRVQVQRQDDALRHAFAEAALRAQQETGLPLFYGTPE